MTDDEFLALEIGTVLEAGKLLPTITDEPIVHEVVEVSSSTGSIRLASTWFGVSLGHLIGVVTGGVIKWLPSLND